MVVPLHVYLQLQLLPTIIRTMLITSLRHKQILTFCFSQSNLQTVYFLKCCHNSPFNDRSQLLFVPQSNQRVRGFFWPFSLILEVSYPIPDKQWSPRNLSWSECHHSWSERHHKHQTNSEPQFMTLSTITGPQRHHSMQLVPFLPGPRLLHRLIQTGASQFSCS